jgi:hypothetical protein
MEKSTFFLWLNDTTHSRHYWNARTQGWVTEFQEASKFETYNNAEKEATFANATTKAEVVVQEMLVPA